MHWRFLLTTRFGQEDNRIGKPSLAASPNWAGGRGWEGGRGL